MPPLWIVILGPKSGIQEYALLYSLSKNSERDSLAPEKSIL